MIHPLLRRANHFINQYRPPACDSSPPTRGKLLDYGRSPTRRRLIPSYEGQTEIASMLSWFIMIHPLLRGANITSDNARQCVNDSSPHARGRLWMSICHNFLSPDSSPHARGRLSAFMRLSAALNTSLCNLHKCHFQLVTHHFHYI